MRAMAGTEPPAKLTFRLVVFLTQGNAAEVCADADHDKPLGFLDAIFVSFGIGKIL